MTPYYMGPPPINIQVDYPTYQTNLTTEEGKNNFDRRYIYNQEVGWRERTASQQRTKDLDMTFGPFLKAVPGSVVKYGLYLGGGLVLAWAASSVALAIYDEVERLVT